MARSYAATKSPIFRRGEWARCFDKGLTSLVEGEVVEINTDKGTIVIFNMMEPPGHRNILEVKAKSCLPVSPRSPEELEQIYAPKIAWWEYLLDNRGESITQAQFDREVWPLIK